MINKIISAVILTGLIFMLGGCGDGEAESAPPVANMRLLSRMFESMERGDYVSAGEQYRKYELSTEEGISPLWGVVIKSNRVIQQVQKHLDAGDLDGALAVAREAKLSDPLNMDIDKLVSELEFLTVLRDSVAGVRSAGESTALDESLRRFDIVYPAAGTDHSAVRLTIPELEQAAQEFAGWVNIGKGWQEQG